MRKQRRGCGERLAELREKRGCSRLEHATDLRQRVAAEVKADDVNEARDLRRPHRASDDDELDDGAQTRRFAAGAVDALVDCGCAGLFAAMWSSPGPRAAEVPPFDRRHDLRDAGLMDASGAETAFGSVWLEEARRERERSVPNPWPATIDVEDYYANLPESLHELRASWERGSSEYPAMLR